MDISIGADVMGTGGKLGELARVIVDARTARVTDIVVKHGFIFGHERVVPITHVTGVEDGTVHVDLDEKGLETMDGYAEQRRGPNPDDVGPPDFDQQGARRGNMALEQTVAFGAAAGYGAQGKPMGYPGGEQLTPENDQRPAIAAGTGVFAADGEKVGEVGALSFAHDTGAPTRLTLKRGLLFKHETELPLDWVREFGPDGVLLHVPKQEAEALAEARTENA